MMDQRPRTRRAVASLCAIMTLLSTLASSQSQTHLSLDM
jgi:hypothetical protein